jgi:hypothetical protein
MDFSHWQIGPKHAGQRRYGGANLLYGSVLLPMLPQVVAHRAAPIIIHILRMLGNKLLYEIIESTKWQVLRNIGEPRGICGLVRTSEKLYHRWGRGLYAQRASESHLEVSFVHVEEIFHPVV